VKVPYVEDKSTTGGLNTPSDDELERIIRSTVDTWKPKRGPDWPSMVVRLGNLGPPAWLVYTAASAALVVILVTAFLVGSALHLGALAPQSVPENLHH
jgi:hypothetical protein